MSNSNIQKTNRKCFWVTNREYAKTSKAFIKACEKAQVQPTKRQASKFRRKLGLAYKHRN